jgi:polyphosphate kinase
MELLARFDEEHNLFWSDRLKEEGAKVIFGIQGLKVHAKVCLITRKEKGELVHYANVATGNYNESTARLYTDHSLFTRDVRITAELQQMFEFIENSYKVPEYKHLIMAPVQMRKRFEKMIEREKELFEKGKPAGIDIKINNLADHDMIEKLVEAAKAGVPVRVIVRATCSVGLAEENWPSSMQIISILDRFLEHSRFIFFKNGGDELLFLTSADWMIRNLNSRVEMACPVFDPEIVAEFREYFNMQWRDNVKARTLDGQQSNSYRRNNEPAFRSQHEIYQWLKKKSTYARIEPETVVIPISTSIKAMGH